MMKILKNEIYNISFIYWELVLRSNLKLSNHHNHIASTKITIVASKYTTHWHLVRSPSTSQKKKIGWWEEKGSGKKKGGKKERKKINQHDE